MDLGNDAQRFGNFDEADFILFVDEAGDPGLRAVAPRDPNGASEWFTLGGVLMHAKYRPELVSWVKKIRYDAKCLQGDSLHFRNLSASKKLAVCEMVASLPIKAFAVASHKRNMKGHENARAAKMSTPDWFYNWCLRILLERVTALAKVTCEKRGLPIKPIRIVLAERGGHSYSQTAVYLDYISRQARHGTSVLTIRQVVPDAIDWHLIDRVQAKQSAGAQLADVVASAFYSAVRRNGNEALETGPAERLQRIMAYENGRIDDFGLVLQPPPYEAEIDAIFKSIFRFYGHVV